MSFLLFKSRSPNPRPGSQKGQEHLDADTAYAAAITALGITKEVGELLKNIPYVKAVAGTVLQIIKIGDVSDQSITLHSGCFDLSLMNTHRRLSKTGIVVWSLLRSSESIRLPCFVHWIRFLSHRKRTN
jgi:hypothetical protein